MNLDLDFSQTANGVSDSVAAESGVVLEVDADSGRDQEEDGRRWQPIPGTRK